MSFFQDFQSILKFYDYDAVQIFPQSMNFESHEIIDTRLLGKAEWIVEWLDFAAESSYHLFIFLFPVCVCYLGMVWFVFSGSIASLCYVKKGGEVTIISCSLQNI